MFRTFKPCKHRKPGSGACASSPGVLPAATACLSMLSIYALPGHAQQDRAPGPILEEVIVTGTQIKGADIAGALPVSVLDSEDIALTGAATGDELLRSIPQMGFVGFNDSTTTGVNAARGDVNSINLRGLGTGNTLVLINGRRMVLHPGTQTENRIPVVTTNANTIPVAGIERLEVLRDGAAALYGSDAVSGVVNYVLRDDFEEGEFNIRYGQSEGTGLDELIVNAGNGFAFNDGRTRIMLSGAYYERSALAASDRAYARNSDLRGRFAGDPLFAGDNSLDNRSGAFLGWGAFTYAGLGTQHVRPSTLTRDNGAVLSPADCTYEIGGGLCLDGGSGDRALRANRNATRQLSPEAQRINVYATLGHELNERVELYSEWAYYEAETNRVREQAGLLANGRFTVPAHYYWNPLGPVTFADGRVNPNRVVPAGDPNVPDAGLGFQLRAFTPFDTGLRRVNVKDDSYRIVIGARGDFGGWDYDTGLVYSAAETVDSTRNRISSTLFQRQLLRDTPDTYNIFNGLNVNDPSSPFDPTPNPRSAIDPMLIGVRRASETSLTLADFKLSHPSIIELPAGSVGMAAGIEWREEDFNEDRDPRSDGTLRFTDRVTGRLLNRSDIVGSSASPDASGSRRVTSLFAEFLIPVLRDTPGARSLDVQFAVRYENFSDVGEVTKPKLALSWYPVDWLQLRGAYSEGFRAPNLTQTSIPAVTVVNTVNDPVTGFSGGMEERRTGNENLRPEESENLTFGFVLTPGDNLTLTADYWAIEQDGVVGLLNADNAVLLDAVLRGQGSSLGRLERDAETGEPTVFNDLFQNQELRDMSGLDLSAFYTLDTDLGAFDFSWHGAYLIKFDQKPGPEQQIIIDAGLAAQGAGSLIEQNGRPRWRSTASARWRRDRWGAGLFVNYVGEVNDTSTRADNDTASPGKALPIDAFLTLNASLDYRFAGGFMDGSRLRLGINNVFDEDPPLADEQLGFFGSLHSNRGRYVFLDYAINW